MSHLTSYYRHTRSQPNAMLDQIGRPLYQSQLLSSNVPRAATVRGGGAGSHSRTTVENLEMSAMGAPWEDFSPDPFRLFCRAFVLYHTYFSIVAILQSRQSS